MSELSRDYCVLEEEAICVLKSVQRGIPQRSIVYHGDCSAAKTAMLNTIKATAEEFGVRCFCITGGNGGFVPNLCALLSHGLTSLCCEDLTEVLVEAGRTAHELGDVVCLLIDEMHRMRKVEIEEMTTALHRCNQLGLPVIMFCTGRSETMRFIVEACPYAERLFLFRAVDTGSDENAEEEDAVCQISAPATDGLKETISKAVEECIENGILEDFLKSNKDEVINMLCNEWTREMDMEVLNEENEGLD